ncbi:MAG: helix-turn-helix domain-containing protein [Alphaproteobacteria bacterium]
MSGPNVGAALKAARLSKGLTLEQVGEMTRVRGAYLAAIENFRLDLLPSRPFTVGYVRAYAQALGLDGEAAVARFRDDDPLLYDGLAAPIGVDISDRGLGTIVFIAVIMVIGILAWNIAQRSTKVDAPVPPSAPATAIAQAQSTGTKGYFELGSPLPAPVESSAPAPYETPGLAKAMSGLSSSESETPADDTTLRPLMDKFVAKGPIFGASAAESQIIVQARKSSSLIVRGPDGVTYFARQLATGQAYRAPSISGLSVEVFDADAIQLFVAGESHGLVPVGKSTVAQLAPSP